LVTLNNISLTSGVLLVCAMPASAEPLFRALEFEPPARIAHLSAAADGLMVGAANGRQWRLVWSGAAVSFVPAPPRTVASLPAQALPDGVVTHHAASGLSAWLIKPTRRYDHGVLGDEIEAGGVRVRDRSTNTYDYVLDDRAVFEDRRVRFWDIDGDATPEMIVVQSGLETGAALVALSLRDGVLRRLAASQPIGRAYRWLNPVGAADFDGDGRIEIAAVITPHLGALLRLYRLQVGRLMPVYQAHGFSNHGIGMRTLDLAAVLDVDGDGVADIAAPNAARTAMRLVSFVGGKFVELGRISHDASIAGDSVVFDHDGAPAIAYPLSNGRLAIIDFPKGRLALTKH